MLMKNYVLLAIFVVIAGLIGGAVLLSKKSPDIANELTKPWIEVVRPKVVELAVNQKDKVRELFTGDELSAGAVVEVLVGGLANIHFPDGSVARLDGDTKLVIEKGSFDPKNENLSVSLNLIFGRVWSKIIKLATPESHWEVKTSTAVATVRGTAFGVEYSTDGKFNITGYENKVEVAVIDPITKRAFDKIKLIVEPEKFLEINKAAVAEIQKRLANNDIKEAASAVMSSAGALFLEVKAAPRAVLDKAWIKRGIEEDSKLEKMISKLRETIKDDAEIRKEIRKDLRDQFLEVINDRREVLEKIPSGIVDIVKEVVDVKVDNAQPTNTEPKFAPTNNVQDIITPRSPVNINTPIVPVLPVELKTEPQELKIDAPLNTIFNSLRN